VEHATETQKKHLRTICSNFKNLFGDPYEKLTYTRVEATIRSTNESPIYSRHYPYPEALRPKVEKQIQELLANDIIRPSRSPYNSPIWIFPKKMDASGQRKHRMVIDYRKLNMVTIPDRYPITDINNVLAQLGQNKSVSVIDLKSGFHQIPLRKADIEKTAFSVRE